MRERLTKGVDEILKDFNPKGVEKVSYARHFGNDGVLADAIYQTAKIHGITGKKKIEDFLYDKLKEYYPEREDFNKLFDWAWVHPFNIGKDRWEESLAAAVLRLRPWYVRLYWKMICSKVIFWGLVLLSICTPILGLLISKCDNRAVMWVSAFWFAVVCLVDVMRSVMSKVAMGMAVIVAAEAWALIDPSVRCMVPYFGGSIGIYYLWEVVLNIRDWYLPPEGYKED